MDAKEFSDLNVALRGATWTAEHNPLLDLPREQLLSRLGAAPPAGEPSLNERETRSMARLAQPELEAAAVRVPVAVDLRSLNGKNYITGVKDQGGCGSCVAFGSSAAMDGAMRFLDAAPIGTPKGHTLQDVSEAQLYYCSTSGSDHHNCASGWWPTSALAYAKSTGLAPEACFPYTAGDQACHLSTGWQKLVTKVGITSSLTSASAMQQWLAEKGPLITCFTVYDDFFAYHSGVYTHKSGAQAGGHCVCCIGYSQSLKAWLCKNSWGPTWGLGGYFWIGFGQCGIDSDMWGISSFSEIYHT